MRIEAMKRTECAIGDIVECVTQRLRVDTPDRDQDPLIVIEHGAAFSQAEVISRIGSPLDGIADLDRLAHAAGFEAAPQDLGPRPDDAWKKIPLRVFAAEFFKHHFEYLGPEGAEEMADSFMQKWSEFH